MTDLEIQIGNRIELTRRRSNLTLDELAKRSNVAKATISKIERNLISPSISTLIKISRGLNRNLSYFVSEEGSDEVVFMRREDQKAVELKGSRLRILGLTKRFSTMQIEAKLAIVEKGGGSDGEHFRHEGQEFVYCLKGCLEFKIAGTTYEMRRGDSIHFPSHLRHEWRNGGKREAQVLWIYSPMNSLRRTGNGLRENLNESGG